MTWQERYRSTRWREPLYVALYPIAADGSSATQAFVAGLDPQRFKAIDRFFVREAARYKLDDPEPVRTRLKGELEDRPPERAPDASLVRTALWSLSLRYWAWLETRHAKEPEDIRMFVLFHDPRITPVVPHSLGLTKGLIGVVYAFATPLMDGENDVVIAHELLHTLGATDKYNPVDDLPLYPDGYAEPREVPLYPQSNAELMAGRRSISRTQAVQPASLDEAVIGPATAREIRWLK